MVNEKLPYSNICMENLPDEIWKEIPSFENYEVSNLGRVKSLSRLVIRKNGRYYYTKDRILKQAKSKHTNTFSLYVVLPIATRVYKNITVAQLVLTTFCGNKLDNEIIHHVNLCSHDNRLSNLRYTSIREKWKIEFKEGIRDGMNNTKGFRNHPTFKERQEIFKEKFRKSHSNI